MGPMDILEQRCGGNSKQFGVVGYWDIEAVVADEAGKVRWAGLWTVLSTDSPAPPPPRASQKSPQPRDNLYYLHNC